MTVRGSVAGGAPALAVARHGMLALAAGAAVVLAASLPAAHRERTTVCSADCPPNALTAAQASALDSLGPGAAGYVWAGLVLVSLLSTTYLVVAVLLLRGPVHREALPAAGALVAVGVTFPQTLPALAAGSAAAGALVSLTEVAATAAFLSWVLTYPDGRFRPRWAAGLVVAFAASGVAATLGRPLPRAVDLAGGLVVLFAVVVLVLHRHRRLPAADRTAARWVVAAFATALVALLAATLAQQGLGIAPGSVGDVLVQVGIVGAFLLPPLAIAGSVVRRGLLDLGSTLSRAASLLLTATAATGGYLLLVTLATRLPLERSAAPVVAVALLALGLVPLHSWMRHRVNRALYGMREDPAALLAALVGPPARFGQLEGTSEPTGAGQAAVPGRPSGRAVDGAADLPTEHPSLDVAAEALREALLLPAAVVEVDGVPRARSGEVPAARPWQRLPLVHGGATVGHLLLAARPAGPALTGADQRVVAPVLAHLAALVHAVRLEDGLARAHQDLARAREEERRRVRDELHDGLGPTLSAVRLSLAAATNHLQTDPARARALISAARTQVGESVADVRRLVYGLRPPGLDERGLVASLETFARGLASPLALTVVDDGGAAGARLPAAVEVAAYRIALEAVTNAVRHSGGTRCSVHVALADAHLEVRVRDDGRGTATAPDRAGTWLAGIGLSSMRARAEELGGSLDVRGDQEGTMVVAVLPLSAPARDATVTRTTTDRPASAVVPAPGAAR
jgi:signal transduction histidine kinase